MRLATTVFLALFALAGCEQPLEPEKGPPATPTAEEANLVFSVVPRWHGNTYVYRLCLDGRRYYLTTAYGGVEAAPTVSLVRDGAECSDGWGCPPRPP